MRVFVDESGNFRPFVADKNNLGERFVTLAAVVFDDKEYKTFKEKVGAIRRKYKKYVGTKEFKSHSIRRSNPKNITETDIDIYDFHKYGEEGTEAYKDFCNDFKRIVSQTGFKIISVSTDKVLAQKLYPNIDVLTTLLTDLWERIFICHHLEKPKKSRIFFDPQLNLTDATLKETYTNFVKSGSRFIDKSSVDQTNLYNNVFSPSSADCVGIQLADYCAYPIKRHVESQNYDFFNKIVLPKLHTNVKDTIRNRRIMMGLKVSLNR